MAQHEEETLYQEARSRLRSLLLGIDPETHARLSPECVVMQPECKVALALAVEALQQMAWIRRYKKPKANGEAHAAPGRAYHPQSRAMAGKDQPRRAGVGWSEREDAEIRRAFQQGQSLSVIARGQQRTEDGVAARLVRLGLVNSRYEARRA